MATSLRPVLAHVVALLLLSAGGAPASDLTGAWTLRLTGFPDPFPTTIVQTGTALTITIDGGLPLTGTIDSGTGVFVVSGVDVPSFSCGSLQGTATSDGGALAGTYLDGTIVCSGLHPPFDCACSGSAGTFAGCRNGSASCCGDGVVGPGEACDPGGTPAATTCCDASCTPKPANATCASDGDACTRDLCDGAGNCTHQAVDAGVPARSLLGVGGFANPAADDRLMVRTTLQFATSPTIDPLHHGLGLVLSDRTGLVRIDVTLPPGAFDGAQGWRSDRSGRTFRFRSRTPVDGAVTSASVAVSSRVPGQVRIAIAGSRGSFATVTPVLPVTARVVLDPIASPTGCGAVDFPGASALRCALSGNGLRCR